MDAMSIGMIDSPPNAPSRAKRGDARIQEIVDPDHDLVDRWQSGDDGAFHELIRRHERRVFRLLFRMMGNREEAEDVAQEAFLSLHRHGHRFRREARFSTFVYRVAANAALNRRRTLGRNRNRVSELKVSQEAGFDLPPAPRDPEDAAVGAEAQERVQRALLELPDDLRVAVLLYDIEGQSYQEVARALGIPEGTVKSRIHRARSALRIQLKSYIDAGKGGMSS
jgi:RNA polymerase sigma-70 factor (ECF subfamily)